MASSIGLLLELIAETLNALPGVTWGVQPAAIWFPEFDRSKLKTELLETGGPTAVVIAPEAMREPTAREKSAGSKRSAEVHIAIIAPVITGTFEEAGAVVEVSELVAEALQHARVANAEAWAVCVEAKHEPIIVADYVRQYGLWVSYLKCDFQASA